MNENTITLRLISDILKENFYIPSYQRGYRWTEKQMEDLLEDINAFTPAQTDKSDKKTWYCLQPVVVKKCEEEKKAKNNLQETWYEVIDGQQRLTSIFLILHYANEMWIGKQKISKFQIKYETRESSSQFLEKQEIDELKEEAEINYENIDYYHISRSYNTIHSWVKNFKGKYNKDFDNNDFLSKLKLHTKVIWYEVAPDKDAIAIFTRINMGKIPLTNAELIKALFLNSSNFPDSTKLEEIRLRQLEIASEWDRMEYSLQNDELWYFINNSENNLPTRIECIFNIMESIEDGQNDNDEYSTFHFFSEKFKSKSKNEIDKNWKEIKKTFQTIEEWFTDRELYHKVGFLITSGEKIAELLKKAGNCQKHEFKKFLNGEISKKVKYDDLEELEYGNGRIKNILLLHNILTMLSNKNEKSRFPFDRFKKERWDIEHIHAIATKVKVAQDDQKKWLDNNFVKPEQSRNQELDLKIDEITRSNTKISDEEFQSIIEYVLGDEDNTLRNLCLLDQGTNRSYKNDAFNNKRNKIIVNEKGGIFIPICTRNVFMKYYTKKIKDLELWNENDRNDYLDDIRDIISKKLEQ